MSGQSWQARMPLFWLEPGAGVAVPERAARAVVGKAASVRLPSGAAVPGVVVDVEDRGGRDGWWAVVEYDPGVTGPGVVCPVCGDTEGCEGDRQ